VNFKLKIFFSSIYVENSSIEIGVEIFCFNTILKIMMKLSWI